MPKAWSLVQTMCQRQSHFALHQDGKEKGMVQKAKTKWGDAELSKTAERSSGVMSRSWEGNCCVSHISPVHWQVQAAAPTEHHRFHSNISLIATRHFD